MTFIGRIPGILGDEWNSGAPTIVPPSSNSGSVPFHSSYRAVGYSENRRQRSASEVLAGCCMWALRSGGAALDE